VHLHARGCVGDCFDRASILIRRWNDDVNLDIAAGVVDDRVQCAQRETMAIGTAKRNQDSPHMP
jgi:hypothetical protein